jgi:pimeloyl-ACP methyl ester carboxylesterase
LVAAQCGSRWRREVISTEAEAPEAHVEIVGTGEPLLILHGWGSGGDLMMPIADRLEDRHRCYVVDFPGHGGTAEPEEPWSVEDFADWTKMLMDRLGIERADVIGHSHGGRVAITLAADYPERVHRLVLVASAGIRSPRTFASWLRVRRFKFVRRLAHASILPSSWRVGMNDWVGRQGSDDYRAASGVMRSTLVRLVNSDAGEQLRRVAASTLLVWGDKDDQTPIEQGRVMQGLLKDSGLVVLEGGGHFAYAEQLDRFCRVVENFLEHA